MRVKLDENLPARLVDVLTQLGHDVDTVSAEGLTGSDDGSLWEASQSARRLLVTQDLDFSDARKFAAGSHHGIVVVRLREPGLRALTETVERPFRTESVEQWERCFVIATERRVRVVRPQ